ncbi:MAG: hypothetical protein DRH06_11560, partial [Deltaproteobacteria bacterium]
MASLESIGGKLFVNGEEIALKSDLETKTQIVDFGTVSNDTRTVKANPFFDGVNDAEIATRCVVRAEIYVNGMWSGTNNSTYSNTGLNGYSNLEGIVVQTAPNKITSTSNLVCNGFGNTGDITSAPCRVIVSYQGELVLAPSLIPKPEYIDKDQLATAWVNFDGTDGSIRDSFNVSGVVRNSVGDCTVSFSEPMKNGNYILATSSSYSATLISCVIKTFSSFKVIGKNINTGDLQ